MSLLFNVLWVLFGGGLVIGFEYLVGGLILCLTIVGIPFGLQCFKIAGMGLWPFGRDITRVSEGALSGGLGLVMNVLWIAVAGIWIFLSHLALALALAITLIGIPFAIQHVKLAFLALAPFGKRVVELR
jgi:uncharacterized membrane protein YccF (DUF307 family)